MDKLLKAAEVADRLAVTERHVESLTSRGELPVVKVGSLRRYTEDDVAAYVRRRRSGGDGT